MGVFLYQQSHLQIHADDEGWIYAAWNGLQSENEMRSGCEEILQQARRRGAVSILNDQTLVQGTWLHLADWVALDWVPRLRAAGVGWLAWVYSTRFVELAATVVHDKAPPGAVRLFGHTTEAAQWLREQQQNDRRRTQRIVLPPPQI